jgi:U4/U6 small nuclear ribonucleoprotein PRP4
MHFVCEKCVLTGPMLTEAMSEATTPSSVSALTREYLEQQKFKDQAKNIIVPTNDETVRTMLRRLGEPITYFGEDKADRRARLQKLLVQKTAQGEIVPSIEEEHEKEEEDEEFYTHGGNELLEARMSIARYSLPRTKKRIEQQHALSTIPLIKHVKFRREIQSQLGQFASIGTQSGFERPVSATVFSPNSQMVAVGDWAGEVKVLDVPNLDQKCVLRGGHTGKVSGISWHPQATVNLSDSAANFATGGLEGNVQLWSLADGAPVATLKGHEGRVCKVDFHPSGDYLASGSFDLTWRLWDVRTQQELLTQEGHSKGLFTVRFQKDGALLASAGLDAIGRIWDLRTGRTNMILDGHIREIYSVDFSPNGYQVVTGGADNSAIVWDIRQVKRLFTIPAHIKMISDVKFFQGLPEELKDTETELTNAGTFLATASYDQTIKIWSADNWALQKSLKDSERILSVDISNGRLLF